MSNASTVDIEHRQSDDLVSDEQVKSVLVAAHHLFDTADTLFA